jgi:hypothetical protein
MKVQVRFIDPWTSSLVLSPFGTIFFPRCHLSYYFSVHYAWVISSTISATSRPHLTVTFGLLPLLFICILILDWTTLVVIMEILRHFAKGFSCAGRRDQISNLEPHRLTSHLEVRRPNTLSDLAVDLLLSITDFLPPEDICCLSLCDRRLFTALGGRGKTCNCKPVIGPKSSGTG